MQNKALTSKAANGNARPRAVRSRQQQEKAKRVNRLLSILSTMKAPR